MPKQANEMLWDMLTKLAISKQPCDITRFKGKPIINVQFDQKIVYALMYGAGAKTLADMMSEIKLSNGEIISFNEIWTINPMPKNGFTAQELAEVDLSDVDQPTPYGKSLREMISETYCCQSGAEEDQYLRRYIAS